MLQYQCNKNKDSSLALIEGPYLGHMMTTEPTPFTEEGTERKTTKAPEKAFE